MYVYTQENASGIAVNCFKLHSLGTQFEELLPAVRGDRLARQASFPCKSLHVIVIPAAATTCRCNTDVQIRRGTWGKFPLIGHTSRAPHFPTHEQCTSVLRQEAWSPTGCLPTFLSTSQHAFCFLVALSPPVSFQPAPISIKIQCPKLAHKCTCNKWMGM